MSLSVLFFYSFNEFWALVPPPLFSQNCAALLYSKLGYVPHLPSCSTPKSTAELHRVSFLPLGDHSCLCGQNFIFQNSPSLSNQYSLLQSARQGILSIFPQKTNKKKNTRKPQICFLKSRIHCRLLSIPYLANMASMPQPGQSCWVSMALSWVSFLPAHQVLGSPIISKQHFLGAKTMVSSVTEGKHPNKKRIKGAESSWTRAAWHPFPIRDVLSAAQTMLCFEYGKLLIPVAVPSLPKLWFRLKEKDNTCVRSLHAYIINVMGRVEIKLPP